MSYVNRPPRGQQRDKLYREALRIELAAAGENLKELREIAKVHIAKCKEGDLQAIRELADRLDGRPSQETFIADTEERPLMKKIVREFVHVSKTQEEIDREIDGEDGDVADGHNGVKIINGNESGNGHEGN